MSRVCHRLLLKLCDKLFGIPCRFQVERWMGVHQDLTLGSH